MSLLSLIKRFRVQKTKPKKAVVEPGDAVRAKVAKSISSETGCSFDQALDLLDDARSCGIKPRSYLGMKGWDFTSEELASYQKALALQAAKRESWQDWYVKVVCERTGWSEQAARAKMDAAKEKGYTYRTFISNGLCKKSEEELASLEPLVVLPKKAKKKVKRDYQVAQDRVMNRELPFEPKNNPKASNRVLGVSDLHQEACARIMEEMGWTIGRMRVNYILAKAHCGCTFDEWVKYRLYAMDPEEQLTYITQETHLKLQLRWVDFGGDFVYFENKGKFNELFSRFVHRRWFLSDGLTWESFSRNIEGLDYLFVKDVEGIGGFNAGKYAVNGSDAQNREVFDLLKENPRLICEECFEQHRDIAALYPDAVSTIRVFTFLRDGVPEVLFAGIRVGLSGVVDNLSSGGMMCGIDLETGKIVTHGATKSCEPVYAHPVTGIEFLGLTIPSWPRVMEIAKEAALLLPANPYVGWDVAISQDGTPELIEGNHNPAAWIMQISWVVGPEVRGNRHIVDGLVDFGEDD